LDGQFGQPPFPHRLAAADPGRQTYRHGPPAPLRQEGGGAAADGLTPRWAEGISPLRRPRTSTSRWNPVACDKLGRLCIAGGQPLSRQGTGKMFSHVTVGVRDLERAARFYDA